MTCEIGSGCLGGYDGNVLTPNIDTLAARGTLSTVPMARLPKCASSRVAIMIPVHFRNYG
ncbi:MAG: hypothetical protein M2R45_02234 [Verrucomicrobia subdivision 3 bacterium]|nr:hypothetical protein [Limisphaerales bacterium]MCS1413981.1 hypothetical protein [Limisphaerales bacterium]